MLNSFAQGFPGTGSLSRSAVNNASGVRTPLGNIFTSAIVLLSLLFFTPYFSYIPKATLAGIIIAAVVFMIEIRVVAPMWRTKSEFLLWLLLTFNSTFVSLQKATWFPVSEHSSVVLPFLWKWVSWLELV